MKVDVHSTTWETVRASIETAITRAQTRLEMPLSPDETNIERGKLLALREQLKLGEPAKAAPIMTGDSPIY